MNIEYIEQLLEEANRAIDNRAYKLAEKMLLNALYDEPAYAKVHNNLGWLYQYCLNEPKLANLHLKYAVKFDPKCEAALYNLIDLYFDHDGYDELKVILTKYYNEPGINKYMVYEALGKIHEVKGEFSKALSYYKKAMYITLDNYEATSMKRNIKRCKYKKFKRLFKWQLQN